MKIAIVNTYDQQGGAAIASYRLHRTLLNEGIDSQMLVKYKSSADHTVIELTTKRQKAFQRIFSHLDFLPVRFYNNRNSTPFSPGWIGFNLVEKINAMQPDIVHLHWVHGMLSIEDIIKIQAPIIWSMHDNWLFTGGCHIKWECELYKNQCGTCPRLASTKSTDLSRWIWLRKEKAFTSVHNMTVIGLSRWITNSAKESNLLKRQAIVNIPNPINTHIFKPFDQNQSRKYWNLPLNTKLVLFGAMNATSDINKGFKELREALYKLTDKNIEFVVFGNSESKGFQDFGFKTHYLGKLKDDVDLVTLYSAVDIMIVPSLQENLSNTILESLACGTPVAAFDVGGNSDIIEHQINGYLAKPFDTTDLANGIEWVLNNQNYADLCRNGREKVLKEFDSTIVAQKYINLYKEILNG